MPLVAPIGAVLAGAEQVAQDLVAHPRTVTLRKRLQSLQDMEVGANRGIEFLVEDCEVMVALVAEQARAVNLVTGTLERQSTIAESSESGSPPEAQPVPSGCQCSRKYS
jgi:hypothetical protein